MFLHVKRECLIRGRVARWFRTGLAEIGTPYPDRYDRDDQAEQHDAGRDQEGAGEASSQGVVVDRGERCLAGPRRVAGPGGGGRCAGGLGVEAVGDDGPGDGAEHGQSDRAADLLTCIAQASRDP